MNMSIGVAAAVMVIAFVNPVYGQRAPGRATDAALLVEVVRSLRAPFAAAKKVVHLNERSLAVHFDARLLRR